MSEGDKVKDEMAVPEDEAGAGAVTNQVEVGKKCSNNPTVIMSLMTKSIENAFYRVVQRD